MYSTILLIEQILSSDGNGFRVTGLGWNAAAVFLTMSGM